MLFGLVLLAVGIVALLVKLGVLAGSTWDYAWPVILIVLGLGLLLGRRRGHGFWRGCCWPRDDEQKK